jgi:membrane protein DedA with SNARE-associated domain
MPTHRFYIANVLSAMIWAPALVFSGDLLAHALGPENMAVKLIYVAAIAAVISVLAPWIRRLFTTK